MSIFHFDQPSKAILNNEQIKQRGFEIVRKIGAGRTRDVYEAIMKRGSLRKVVALKIPNPANALGSVCTMINLSKGDLNEREVEECNDLRHPNIVDIYDIFQVEMNSSKLTVTAESFVDGETLGQMVEDNTRNLNSMESEKFRKYGKRAEEILTAMREEKRLEGISDEYFSGYFSQVLDGVGYIHEKGKIHRDIKPSNILLERRTNRVIISDLQNTGGLDSIVAKNLPTRGGTPYTHPRLLNSLVTGDETKADRQTDFYSIGATMFYALTGMAPFDYNVTEDENGTPLMIGDRTIRISLIGAGKKGIITPEEHDSRLEKTLRQVPRKYRDMLRKCLSFECGYKSIHGLKQGFEKAVKSRYEKLWSRAKTGSLVAAGIALLGTTLGLGIHMGQEAEKNQKSVEELLRNKDYGYFGVKFRSPTLEDGERIMILKPCFNSARERLSLIPDLNEIEQEMDYASRAVFGHRGKTRCNKRIFYSIIRSCLAADTEEIRNEYGNSRVGISLIPDFWDDFCRNQSPILRMEPDDMERIQYLTAAADYVNACTTVHDDIDDIVARYFCTKEEIYRAQLRARCREGYPSTDSTERGTGKDTGRGDGPTISTGYIAHLPRVKRDLVNTAVAFYLVTDDDGQLNPASRDSAENMSLGTLSPYNKGMFDAVEEGESAAFRF